MKRLGERWCENTQGWVTFYPERYQAMLLSNACEYAIRASLYLALKAPEDRLSVKDIATELGIPYAFLAKIAQKLSTMGVWNSTRGPQGGVDLAHPASTLTLYQIVEAIDGTALFTQCVLGLHGCGDLKPCPLHASWGGARAKIEEMFKQSSLDHVAKRIKEGQVRLSDPSVTLATDLSV